MSDTEQTAENTVLCCPECGDTQFWSRTTKTPDYRCRCGAEFDVPEERSAGPSGREANTIPAEDVVTDLARVADDLGHPPRQTDYGEHGEYSTNTVRARFASWDRALTAAELDPTDVPDERGRKEGAAMLLCYRCDTQFESSAEWDTVTCSSCGSDIQRHRAIIAARKNTKAIDTLADGPTSASEFPHGGITWSVRDIVCRLRVPKTGNGSGKRRPAAEMVYYLYGDERAAIRTFINVNHDYVESCLGDTSNPLAANWPDELYQLLVEQWAWMDGGDSE